MTSTWNKNMMAIVNVLELKKNYSKRLIKKI